MSEHMDKELLEELRKEARRQGLTEEEVARLARLAHGIRSLPAQAPAEALRRGRERLSLALAQGRRGPQGLLAPGLLKAAAVVSVAVLGLTTLGGVYASGLRLPERVAVGPLQPLAAPAVSEVAHDNHGQKVSQAAQATGGDVSSAARDNHGQQVADAATSGGDVRATARDNHGQQVSSVASASQGPASSKVELVGRVEAVGADGYTVNGMRVHVSSATEVKGQVGVGAVVKVEGSLGPEGVMAREIEVKQPPSTAPMAPTPVPPGQMGFKVELHGVVAELTPEGLSLEGYPHKVLITENTRVEGRLEVGAWVEVKGVFKPGGEVEAWNIEVKAHPDDGDDIHLQSSSLAPTPVGPSPSPVARDQGRGGGPRAR